jgi:uncharacterized protein (DUF486 family)
MNGVNAEGLSSMKYFSTVLLLICSNGFMIMAWYGHLKKDGYAVKLGLPLIILASWGIAFFEYCFQVPANRLGAAAGISTGQLKILQEVITLAVFVPFLLLYLKESWRWDYLWAMLCLVGAVYFVFRQSETAPAPAIALAAGAQNRAPAPAGVPAGDRRLPEPGTGRIAGGDPGGGAGEVAGTGLTIGGGAEPAAPVEP